MTLKTDAKNEKLTFFKEEQPRLDTNYFKDMF